MCHKGTDHTRAAHSSREETPLDIVRRRYAAGEITREQFEQLRRDLGVDPPPGSTGYAEPRT